MNARIVKKVINKVLGKTGSVDKLYSEHDYLEAYSKHTDLRVENDPKTAVGGMWEVIGPLQFEFLTNKGMQPDHKMLDIGCGTLRGGIHCIKYLNSGNYYGLDISSKAIAFGKDFVAKEGLSDKQPQLIVSQNKDLKLEEFQGQKFDYIFAQSVFTHLKPEHITECFANVGKVMHKDTVFYFTYFKSKKYRQFNVKDFSYPFSFFESLAQQFQFTIRDCSADYDHPRKQVMV